MMLIALASLLMPAAFAFADPHSDDIHRVSLGIYHRPDCAVRRLHCVFADKSGQQDLEDGSVRTMTKMAALAGLSGLRSACWWQRPSRLSSLPSYWLDGCARCTNARTSRSFIGIIPCRSSATWPSTSLPSVAARNRADITRALLPAHRRRSRCWSRRGAVLLSYPLGNKMDLTFVPLEIIGSGCQRPLAYISAAATRLAGGSPAARPVAGGVVFFFFQPD